jgi:hypothetical protein
MPPYSPCCGRWPERSVALRPPTCRAQAGSARSDIAARAIRSSGTPDAEQSEVNPILRRDGRMSIGSDTCSSPQDGASGRGVCGHPPLSANDCGSDRVRHVPRRRVISAAPSAEPREPSAELPDFPIAPNHDQHQQDQDDDDHRDLPWLLFHPCASRPMSPRATGAQGDLMDPPLCRFRSGVNALDEIAARRLDDVPLRLLPSGRLSTLGARQ